jgi:hypothetical protein
MAASRFALALLSVIACSGPRGEATPDPAHEPVVPSAAAAQSGPTPGVCGPWETGDSASRAECRRSMRRGKFPDSSPVLWGACTYQETVGLAALRACLARSDSSASACPVVHAWRLRQGDGVIRAAEWRRCGPQDGAFVGDSIDWPLHFLLLRRDSLPSSPLIFVFSNAEETGAGGLDTVLAVDFDGDGTDELFYIDHDYGTGASFVPCALAVTGARLHCWREAEYPAQEVLSQGEVFYKGMIPMFGGPDAARETGDPIYATGKSLWYFTPIYRDGDANCCPTSGASLWLEARPRNGQFETGLVLRVREDSNQVVIGADTLHR